MRAETSVTLPISSGGVTKTSFGSHLRRLPIELINIFFNHDWLFWLIGLINRRIGFIQSVFLVYPGNEKYSASYLYKGRIAKAEWEPWPCGVLWQNRRLTVMFCITAHNGQFTDPVNTDKLKAVVARMQRLQELFRTKAKTFAGVLPGILYGKRLVRQAPEADLTAVAVASAVSLVKRLESLQPGTPVIVLGHRGFIGRRLVKLLDLDCVYGVDRAEPWPEQLRGQRVVVVNITLNGAINEYLDLMWPGTVVLNEVYPEPVPEVVARLAAKNCPVYHIAGVAGYAMPSFPEAYAGAIPCCAAWASPDLQAVVTKL